MIDRNAVISDYHEALIAIDALDRLDATGELDSARIRRHAVWWHARLDDAAAAYLEWLPEVPVSRCPLSGDKVSLPIDLVGLDGPFWNSLGPQRKTASGVPSTYLGFDGAVSLAGPPDYAPFASNLGPSVPAVMPGVLQQNGIVAVLSTRLIGRHTGYLVVYYGQDSAVAIPDWGLDHQISEEGPVAADPQERDADLRPWLESQSLRWIEPGDESHALRTGIEGCPYLDVNGSVETVWVVAGERLEQKEPIWQS